MRSKATSNPVLSTNKKIRHTSVVFSFSEPSKASAFVRRGKGNRRIAKQTPGFLFLNHPTTRITRSKATSNPAVFRQDEYTERERGVRVILPYHQKPQPLTYNPDRSFSSTGHHRQNLHLPTQFTSSQKIFFTTTRALALDAQRYNQCAACLKKK